MVVEEFSFEGGSRYEIVRLIAGQTEDLAHFWRTYVLLPIGFFEYPFLTTSGFITLEAEAFLGLWFLLDCLRCAFLLALALTNLFWRC